MFFSKIITKILLTSPLVRSKTVISFGRFLHSIFGSEFVNIEGRKMYLHGNDGLALSIFKVYEPSQTTIVKKLVKNGDVVVDVGAHVGYYTLLMSKLVGEKGRVYSFEPDPLNFDLLKKNIELNGYQNVTLIQKAVTEKNSKVRLFLGDDDRAVNRIYDAKLGDTKKSLEVDSICLDDYFDNAENKIDFIKIDAEGSEIGVINGMTKILKKNKDIKIMTEYYPFLIQKFGQKPENYLKLLSENGFNLFDILEENEKFTPIDLSKIHETSYEKNFCTNLLCMRK